MAAALPEFAHPPLEEVVIGVAFEPLKKFHTAHLGQYWSAIKDRYPLTASQPPIQTEIEQFDRTDIAAVQMPLIAPMPVIPRCWFLDRTKCYLLQLQRNMFIRNWRRVTGSEEYPRFAKLIEEFRSEWGHFTAYVAEHDFGSPNVVQCELTYINHIERSGESEDFANLSEVFSAIKPRDEAAFLPAPEVFSWSAKYKLPEKRGRLHVEVGPTLRGRDMKIVIQFQVTARGAPADKTDQGVFAWFDLAHEWVVRGFDQLTSPVMHERWNRGELQNA